MALVGESGSGKSVSANSILKLLPYPAQSHRQAKSSSTGGSPEGERRRAQACPRNDVTMIFQEPMTSLNPLHTIEQQIGEILEIHQQLKGAAARARTLDSSSSRYSRKRRSGSAPTRISFRAASASA